MFLDFLVRDYRHQVYRSYRHQVYHDYRHPVYPALSRNREKWDETRVRNTLINVFVSVKKHNPKIDTLILGAFGCGAYGNDPDTMAKLMNDIIQEYGGIYKRVVISIPPGRDGNYDSFAQIIDYFD